MSTEPNPEISSACLPASAGALRAQLAWRCRRGMRELDLLLLRWLHARFDRASREERALFAALLELPDPQLAHFLLRGERPLGHPLATLLDAVADFRES